MKRRLLASGVILCIYLGFLVAQLPADRLVAWVPLPSGLGLQGVTGTIWQGSVARVQWQKQVLNDVAWRLPVGRLLLLSPTLELSFRDRETLRGSADVSLTRDGRWRFQDVRLETDAQQLLGRLPLPLPLQAQGRLQLQLDQGLLSREHCFELNGLLRWRQGVLETPAGPLALGETLVRLSCEQGKLQARLEQASEQLSLSGVGELAFTGDYRFKGRLIPGQTLAPELAQGLTLVGPRDSQGHIRLDISGRL